MTNIDMTKLLSKLLPEAGGEDVVRMRTGIVDAVNSNGTVNLGIAGIVVPNIPRLANAPMVAGTVVNVVSFRGSLLVIGPSASSSNTLVPISTHMQGATADLPFPTALSTPVNITGCSFSFTTTVANAVVMADMTVDWDPINGTNAGFSAYPRLDSTDITSPALIFEVGGNSRIATSRSFRIPVATAGAHTLQARVTKFAGGVPGASGNIILGHTTISGTVLQPS